MVLIPLIWLVVVSACALVGSLLVRPAALAGTAVAHSAGERAPDRVGTAIVRLRAGLWVGIAVLLAGITLVNLRLPVTGAVWWPVWVLAGVGAGVLGWDAVRTRAAGARAAAAPQGALPPGVGGVRILAGSARRWLGPAVITLAIVSVVGALTALGRVSNYDSGLYHWPLIDYAAAYPAIPGLALLSPWFGYASSLFPFAAAFGGLVESSEGARLVNGFFFCALAVDVVLRMGAQRRRMTAGDIAAVVGLGVAFAALGTSFDFVTSPSPDTAPVILLIVAVAAALDCLTVPRGFLPGLLIAVSAATAAASIRVQLWPLAALIVLILVATGVRRRLWRQPAGGRWWPALAIGAVIGGLLLLAQMARDSVLSGWLLYPAPLVKVGGDWSMTRAGVTATRSVVGDFARTLGGGTYQPGSGPVSAWWAWSARNLTDIGLTALIGLLAAAVVLWWAGRDLPGSQRSRARVPVGVWLLIAVLAASVLLSFILAPNPRYVWGPLIGIGLLALSIQAWLLARRAGAPSRYDPGGTVAWVLALLLCAPTLLTVIGRQGSPEVLGATDRLTLTLGPLRSSPLIPAPDTSQQPSAVPVQLADGTIIVRPESGDQCWRVFPLCLGSGPAAGLQSRGPTIADGFRIASPQGEPAAAPVQ